MEWINVNVRLPEEMPYRFEQVIVAKENGVVMEALYNTKVKKFMDWNRKELNHNVTHWMPLPIHPSKLL
ncbi:DUF551 domain-containing protein [bacterium]|jgi:hypothetical protein|nr:DUF551 domain-containing protein [bacterium]